MFEGAIGGAIGGVIGVIMAYANKIVRSHPCPDCGKVLGDRKPGRLKFRQAFVGGWTCPDCGCDVDRHGKERAK